MSYVWFNMVLEALGKRINFESISNLYGNAFAKDAVKAVQASNPLTKGGQKSGGVEGLLGQIKIVDARNNAAAAKEAEKNVLGDTSWAEGLM